MQRFLRAARSEPEPAVAPAPVEDATGSGRGSLRTDDDLAGPERPEPEAESDPVQESGRTRVHLEVPDYLRPDDPEEQIEGQQGHAYVTRSEVLGHAH